MDILYFLAPAALLLSASALCGFIWATQKGQWNNLDLEAQKILVEPKSAITTNEDSNEQSES